MWWPKDASLIPVQIMKLNEKNCAFLEVKYTEKIIEEINYQNTEQKKEKKLGKTKTEYYNMLELHLETLRADQSSKVMTQGIRYGPAVFDYLKIKMDCQDPKIGRYNCLMLEDRLLNFNRIFVFFEKISDLNSKQILAKFSNKFITQ